MGNQLNSPILETKLRAIKLLVLDVDGVLTDGRIVLGSGGLELKFFDSQDGMGIALARRAGLRVAIITGRQSEAVAQRAVELNVDETFQNCPDKLPPYLQLLDKYGLTDQEVACVADDLVDLPILRRAGLKVAVDNAMEEVKALADYITRAKGGRGAVREVVDLILEAQGKQGVKEPASFLNPTPTNEETDMCVEKAKEVIRLEAEAVASLEERIGTEFSHAVEIILNSRGRVIVSGIGKSGIIAKKLAATLSSTGTPAIFLHPTEGVHGDLGVVGREDVVIGISKSGETDEFYQILPIFKRLGLPIIAITGNGGSLLAKQSDVVLDISVEKEACPYDLTPTASTAAALAMGDALAIALLHRREFRQEDFALFHPGGILGRRLLLTVEDLMLTGDEVPIVDEESTMEQTILEMTAKRGVTGVVNRKGVLVGIFVYGDLGRLLKKTKDIFNKKVKEVMIHNPKTITKDRLAAEALQLMEKHGITCLIVIDNQKRPIGIIHLHDVMRAGVV